MRLDHRRDRRKKVMKSTRKFIAALVCLILLTSCQPSSVALLDAIVVSVEIVIPQILPSDESRAALDYLDQVLSIAEGAINGDTTPETVLKTIMAFDALVVPQVKDAKLAAGLAAVSAAVAVFVNSYSGTMLVASPRLSAPHGASKAKDVTLSAKDMRKIEQMRPRISAARLKVSAGLAASPEPRR